MSRDPIRTFGYMFGIVVLALLGYGYWYAHTHAWLDLDLDDEQGKHVRNAKLSFYDETGQLLAEGRTDNEEVGIVYLRHPTSGYCERSLEDKNARWRECLKEHSIWQAKWLPRVTTVNVRIDSCEITGVHSKT